METNLSVTYSRGTALIYSQEGNVNSSISPLYITFCCGPEKKTCTQYFSNLHNVSQSQLLYLSINLHMSIVGKRMQICHLLFLCALETSNKSDRIRPLWFPLASHRAGFHRESSGVLIAVTQCSCRVFTKGGFIIFRLKCSSSDNALPYNHTLGNNTSFEVWSVLYAKLLFFRNRNAEYSLWCAFKICPSLLLGLNKSKHHTKKNKRSFMTRM